MKKCIAIIERQAGVRPTISEEKSLVASVRTEAELRFAKSSPLEIRKVLFMAGTFYFAVLT